MDPARTAQELAWSAQYHSDVETTRARMSVTAGMGADSFLQYFPGVSKEVVAAGALSQLRLTNPELIETVRRDAIQKNWVEGLSTSALGFTTRLLTAGFYDIYDIPVVKPIRMAVDVYQQAQHGENVSLKDAWYRSGVGAAGETGAAIREGELTWGSYGTGYIAGQAEPFERPGVATYFDKLLREGADVDEAYTEALKWGDDKYGRDIMRRAWDQADATKIAVTVNGAKYRVGVSPGRLAAMAPVRMGILTPDTVPFTIISGTADMISQAAFDASNPLFTGITRLAAPMRKLRPRQVGSVDEMIKTVGGRKINDFQPHVKQPGEVPEVLVSEPSVVGRTFHGSNVDSLVDDGISTGGITNDIDEAIRQTRNQLEPGEQGYIYVIETENLPDDVQRVVNTHGQVEQYVELRRLEVDEQQIVDRTVAQITEHNEYVDEVKGALDEF
ncbi:unnamed protein product, partial [marine sediment metagenome]